MSMSNILQAVPGEKVAIGQSVGPALYVPGGFFIQCPDVAVVTRVDGVTVVNNPAFTAQFEGTIGGVAGQYNGVKVKCVDPLTAAEVLPGTPLNTTTFHVRAAGF